MNTLTHGITINQCESGGCLAKIPGLELINLIDNVKNLVHTNISDASASAPEDAAIIDLNDQLYLFTTDIGPLVGVDAFKGGQIAALHALSDIYVMGGVPTHTLLTLVAPKTASLEQKQAVLKGVFCACEEERVNIVGGHSIFGDNFLVGLSIIGTTNGKTILKKQNCKAGDALMISKPLGTGLAARSLFLGEILEEDFNEALDVMLKSNRQYAQMALETNVNALTDVTGFGLAGHLSEMLGEGQGAIINVNLIPKLKVLEKIYMEGMDTIYTTANMQYARKSHIVEIKVSKKHYLPLFDPQTNGPIMASVGKKYINKLERYGFTMIGEVTEGNRIIIN